MSKNKKKIDPKEYPGIGRGGPNHRKWLPMYYCGDLRIMVEYDKDERESAIHYYECTDKNVMADGATTFIWDYVGTEELTPTVPLTFYME